MKRNKSSCVLPNSQALGSYIVPLFHLCSFLIFCGFLSSGFISAAFFLSQPLSTSLEQGSTVRVCYLLEFFALFVFRFFTLILVGLRVILMLFFNGLVGFLRAHRSCFRPFQIFSFSRNIEPIWRKQKTVQQYSISQLVCVFMLQTDVFRYAKCNNYCFHRCMLMEKKEKPCKQC